jgi:hypothetical protein
MGYLLSRTIQAEGLIIIGLPDSLYEEKRRCRI